MNQPVEPVFLFDEDGHLDFVHDLGLTDEMLDTADEVYEAFDGRARPVNAAGPPGGVYLVLSSDQPQEAALRARVIRYYARFVTRSPPTPHEDDFSAFVNAVAEDEVTE